MDKRTNKRREQRERKRRASIILVTFRYSRIVFLRAKRRLSFFQGYQIDYISLVSKNARRRLYQLRHDKGYVYKLRF